MLAQYTYDDMGRRTAVIRGNGHITTYDHDNLSRLTDLEHDAAGTANDLTLEFEYNPAGQITRRARSNTAYDWDIDNLESSSFITNGLNQAVQMYSGPITHDDRGNLTEHSGKTYDYDIFNKPTSVAGTSAQSGNMLNVTYAYDAKGRLKEENDNGYVTQFGYSGTQLIAEYNSSNQVLRRYVHGPGTDEPIVWYEELGSAKTYWLMADHQGSIIGYTNASGTVAAINSYTMEGVPGDNNIGRFGYTGQMWLEGAELYHYKARAYDPQLGRFLQADPIGYGDGLNMYAYVGGDAMNATDPSGMTSSGCSGDEVCTPPTRRRNRGGSVGFGAWRATTYVPIGTGMQWAFWGIGGGGGGGGNSSGTDDGCGGDPDCIVVTAQRQRRFTDGTRIRFGGRNEQGFIVNSEGIFPLAGGLYRPIVQECDDESTRDGLAIRRAAFGSNLGGHTHLNRGERTVGPEDGVLARVLGTAYVMTSDHVFSITHSSGSYVVSVLSGPGLSRSQEQTTWGRIEAWQRHSGGSGVSCIEVQK